MKLKTLVLPVAALLGAALLFTQSGCSTFGKSKSDADALQGKWQGSGQNNGRMSACTFVISGKTFDFRDMNTNIWYTGNFSLREDVTPKQFIATIVDCPARQYVGKTSLCLYKLENGTLTISGNEPGNPNAPAGFDDPNAARFELRKGQ